MPAQPRLLSPSRLPSLTVHTDAATGIRIVLATGRARGPATPVVWHRRSGASLDRAVAEVMHLAESRPAVALLLDAERGDAAGALARCLAKADLPPGFVPGREEAAAQAAPAARAA
ncbi:MAG: hypothetical protein RLY86_4303 [Pseudomonadota bacterium]|jgi:hypothetical protein